jgi:hypothetical protein
MAATRSVEWPTSAATLVAAGAASSAFTHEAKVVWRSKFGSSTRSSGIGSFMPFTSGAALMPQLPAITVVTPCETLKSMPGCDSSAWSSCVCESMKPGATIRPVASMVRAALAPARSPTAEMRPSLMPTSASKRGALVPSMTVPRRMRRS